MKPIVLNGDVLWISPYVFSVVVTLEEKKLSYEYRPLALQDKPTQESAYLDRTITGRVPSLEHDGFVVAESSAIVEYLEEAFPAPAHAAVLPTAVRERARARQLMSWLRSDETAPIRRDRSTSTMFYERTKEPLRDDAKAAAKKLVAVAERVLAGRTQLFESFSLADAELAFMLQRLALNGDELPTALRAFAETQWQRPSVQAFVGRKRPPFVSYGP